jgi:hypothetical protein
MGQLVDSVQGVPACETAAPLRTVVLVLLSSGLLQLQGRSNAVVAADRDVVQNGVLALFGLVASVM